MRRMHIDTGWQDEKSYREMRQIALKCYPFENDMLSIPNDEPKAFVIRDIEKNNMIVGYIIFQEEERMIYDMAVLPEYCRYKNESSQQLFNTMINHISIVGGEWTANLRDNTTLIYMLIQAKRGAARITHFEPELNTSSTYIMGNGDYAYETRFMYVSLEDRHQAAKENEEWIQLMESKTGTRNKVQPEKDTNYFNLFDVVETNIKRLVISGNPASIRGYLSNNYPDLQAIRIESTNPPMVKWDCFEAIDYRKCKLYVPQGASFAYRKYPVWTNFEYIIEAEENCDNHLKSLKYEVHANYLEILETPGCPFRLFDYYEDKELRQHIQLSIFHDNDSIIISPYTYLYAVFQSDNSIVNQSIWRT